MRNSAWSARISSTSFSYKPFIIKLTFFVLLTLLIAINNSTNFKNFSSTCLYDYGIEITNPIAKKLKENTFLRHTLLIISSFLIDLTIFSTMMHWIVKGKSWRFLLIGILFYGIRAIIQFTFLMPFPKNYSFDYPGFPSIMVSYSKTNDFFYSGHVGIPIICAYEFYKENLYIISVLCVCVSFFQGIILLTHHAHYGVDIMIGMVCAHYFCRLVDKYVEYVDECISIDGERGINEEKYKYNFEDNQNDIR